MKRLLQYSQSKKTKITMRHSLSLHALSLASHLLLPHLSLFSFSPLSSRTTLGGTLSLLSLHLAPVSASASRISYLARCFSRALYLWLACIHYMHALHLASTTVHASLPYLYSSSRASWLYAYSTLYLLLYALYLYSVLLGRASSAVVLQRLLNIRCLLCLLCTCSTSSRTGYESESPTNSGVIEDTGNSTCAVYCVGYEEGRGGIQKCCVCWKG